MDMNKPSGLSNRRKDYATAVVVQRAVLLLKRSKVKEASDFLLKNRVPEKIAIRVLVGQYRKP